MFEFSSSYASNYYIAICLKAASGNSGHQILTQSRDLHWNGYSVYPYCNNKLSGEEMPNAPQYVRLEPRVTVKLD